MGPLSVECLRHFFFNLSFPLRGSRSRRRSTSGTDTQVRSQTSTASPPESHHVEAPNVFRGEHVVFSRLGLFQFCRSWALLLRREKSIIEYYSPVLLVKNVLWKHIPFSLSQSSLALRLKLRQQQGAHAMCSIDYVWKSWNITKKLF